MSVTKENILKLSSVEKAIDLDPHNKRIKVYQIPSEELFFPLKQELEKIAQANQCEKIIFYCREDELDPLEQLSNCDHEGKINGFFQGDDAYIYSLFLSPERNKPIAKEEEERVMQIVENDQKWIKEIVLPEEFTMRSANIEDAPHMAELYDAVFETYPTPMNDAEYIAEMMESDVYFTIVEHQDTLVSACSADLFPAYNSAEMTDCATLPEYRGKGLLSHQFRHLEQKMRELGVQTLFSYTRALSVGMNLINARHGYEYTGRMLQNSNISGKLEDMNIWVKTLANEH